MREKIRTKSRDGEFLTLSEAICCFLYFPRGFVDAGSNFSFCFFRYRIMPSMCFEHWHILSFGPVFQGTPYRFADGAVLLALILATAGGACGSISVGGPPASSSNPRFSTSFLYFLTQTLFRLAVCLIVYGLVRCTHGAAVMAALTGVLLVFLKICGYHQNFAGWLILLIGILALFARGGYWRYVDRKTGGGFLTPRRRIGQAALGWAAPPFCWLGWFYPARCEPDRIIPFGTRFFSMAELLRESEYYTYSMTSMGLQEKYGKLGGNITLSDSRPILSVQGELCFPYGERCMTFTTVPPEASDPVHYAFRASSPGEKQRTAFDLLTYP